MLQGALAPVGGTHGWTHVLNFTNREAKIKSVTWDLRVMVTGTANNLPLDGINVLGYDLVLGILGGRIGNHIDLIGAIPAGGVIVGNGTQIYLYKPGQYLFDSFYLRTDLDFNFTIVNNDPLINYTYGCSFIFETQEKIIYQ